VRKVLKPLILLCGIIAVVCGIVAATIEVRDSMDHFIGDLQRQGRWAAYAAIAAGIGMALEVVDYFIERGLRKRRKC
jgi:hypothetical protein